MMLPTYQALTRMTTIVYLRSTSETRQWILLNKFYASGCLMQNGALLNLEWAR